MSTGLKDESIVDQVLSRWYEKLLASGSFDADSVSKVRDLAARGRLKTAAQLSKVIKMSGGDNADR